MINMLMASMPVYAYKRLRRLQDQDIAFKLRNTTLSPAQERRYKKLKDDIIAEVKSLRLKQTRIDSLVDQQASGRL
jgi:RNA polymerase primary sigma factor